MATDDTRAGGDHEDDGIDWALVERNVAGRASDTDRRAIARWAREDPAGRAWVEALRAASARAAAAPPRFDAAAAWQRVSREIVATGESTAKWRHAPRRRSWSAVGPPAARAWARAAAVALAVAGGTYWWRVHEGRRDAAPTDQSTQWLEVAAAPGRLTALSTSDGSRIVLAPGSRLRYPRAFGSARRDLWLTGEAHFTVATDSTRPFTVRAAHADVRALGTAFLVRAYPDDSLVRVAVADGRVAVRLRAGGDTAVRAVLARGELADLAADGTTSAARVDARRDLGWVGGRLVFRNVPVPTALARLSRWYGVELRTADPSVSAKHLTTTVANADLSDVLDAVAAALDAEYEHRGGAVVFRSRRPSLSRP